MKTIITIEDGRVTVQVDDQKPIKVEQVQLPPVSTTTVNTMPKEVISTPVMATADKEPKKLPHRTCAVCGNIFTPTHALQKYDSKKCRTIANNATFRAKKQHLNPSYKNGPGEVKIPIFDNPPQQDNSDLPPFEDQWDCDKCRSCLTYCPLHEQMMRSGSVPPRFRNSS